MKTKEYTDEEGRKTVYLFDDLERQIRTTDYDENCKISCDIHYQHNENNQVIGWKVYQPENVLFLTFEVDYDSDGTEKETRQYNSKGELELRTISIYNEAKDDFIEKTFDANGQEIFD